MRRYLPLAFVAFILSSDIALSAVIKEAKQGKSIEFYTNETGTVEKKAEITSAGRLKVKEVTDLAGTGTPPGMVPIGGMVAVMPNTHANTWQPPATGVIKDGFMRANGHIITSQNVIDGSLIPEGTALPNMVDRFARGATTSNTELGSDSVTPSGTVSQPSFAGDAESRSAWFKSQGISATTKGHYHSMSGAGTTLDVGALGTTNVSLANGSMSDSEFEHNHSLTGSVSGTFASTTHTHNLPKHYHSEASHTTGLVADSHTHSANGTLATNSTTSVGSSTHTHGSSGLQAEIVVSGGLSMVTGTFSACTIETNRSISGTVSTATQEPGFCTPIRGSTDGPSTPTVSLNNIDIDGSTGTATANGVTGYVGEDIGGCNGDLDTGCDTTQLIAGGTASVSNGDLGVGADNIGTARTVTGTTNITHDHGLTGSIGKVTSGCDGNTDGSCSVTFNENNNDMQQWSAAGDYTPSGTVSQPSFSGNALDNKPAYTTVVWVIRVM